MEHVREETELTEGEWQYLLSKSKAASETVKEIRTQIPKSTSIHHTLPELALEGNSSVSSNPLSNHSISQSHHEKFESFIEKLAMEQKANSHHHHHPQLLAIQKDGADDGSRRRSLQLAPSQNTPNLLSQLAATTKEGDDEVVVQPVGFNRGRRKSIPIVQAVVEQLSATEPKEDDEENKEEEKEREKEKEEEEQKEIEQDASKEEIVTMSPLMAALQQSPKAERRGFIDPRLPAVVASSTGRRRSIAAIAQTQPQNLAEELEKAEREKERIKKEKREKREKEKKEKKEKKRDKDTEIDGEEKEDDDSKPKEEDNKEEGEGEGEGEAETGEDSKREKKVKKSKTKKVEGEEGEKKSKQKKEKEKENQEEKEGGESNEKEEVGEKEEGEDKEKIQVHKKEKEKKEKKTKSRRSLNVELSGNEPDNSENDSLSSSSSSSLSPIGLVRKSSQSSMKASSPSRLSVEFRPDETEDLEEEDDAKIPRASKPPQKFLRMQSAQTLSRKTNISILSLSSLGTISSDDGSDTSELDSPMIDLGSFPALIEMSIQSVCLPIQSNPILFIYIHFK